MIPLSVPNLSGNEWKYIKDCLDTNWVSSVGSYVSLFEEKVAAFCSVKHAIATSNGTAALHISLLLAGVKQGDLAIVPNITFVAPVNTIRYLGADPVLIDVDPLSWQMDLDILSDLLEKETVQSGDACRHAGTGKRISAIIPVHVLGNMCDMDKLMRIAEHYRIPVIEDATEALGSSYKGKSAGSFGKFGCLSFNGNKIITTGGGGMILTDDDDLARHAKHITTQAKSRPDEYYHDEVGYNYRLVNILAAMGVAQMEQLPSFIKRKKEIALTYDEAFQGIVGFQPQQIAPDVNANHWLYTVKVPNQAELRRHLLASGLEARPFWVPMNQLPAFGSSLYFHSRDRSNEIYRNCLSLPCSTSIGAAEMSAVIDSVKEFYSDRIVLC
jgi:perosamine synthetase